MGKRKWMTVAQWEKRKSDPPEKKAKCWCGKYFKKNSFNQIHCSKRCCAISNYFKMTYGENWKDRYAWELARKKVAQLRKTIKQKQEAP
jgi:hypothetical protein